MAKRQSQRHEWHHVNGKWTRSFGERGLRITLFQKRKGGTFYRLVWHPGRGRDRRCLHTKDRTEAERLARELLARTMLQDAVPVEVSATPETQDPSVTLDAVLHRYCTEAATFLDNGEAWRNDAFTRAKILRARFGPECDVRDLTEDDVASYTTWRLAGGIMYDTDPLTNAPRMTHPVRMRSVEADLKLLYAALKWATTVRVGNGRRRWLEYHPLAGVRRPREKNPKRPIATWERFQKARATAQRLVAEAEAKRDAATKACTRMHAEATRDKWIRVELMLVLAEATGRRAGAIRQLRWDDVYLPAIGEGNIRWRSESDKKRKEWMTPIPPSLVEELRTFQQKLGAVGGWMFPSQKDSTQPIRRDVLRSHVGALERHAKLPKLEGGLLHPYRRKWATERKHLPLKDVAAAGGWQDEGTLLTCYQQADRETMLAVMCEPRKVTEAGVAST